MESINRYVGLTNNLEARKKQNGKPRSFNVVRQFRSEYSARKWEKEKFDKGYKGNKGGKGWKYGYTYSKKK